MSDFDYKIIDDKTALLRFKKWLASAYYLPNEIGRMINISHSFHVLPVGDISYEFENEWSAIIGILQEEKYQKAYDKVKQYNSNVKVVKLKPYPDKNEFIVWSYGQGTNHNHFSLFNRIIFSFDNLLEEKKVVSEFIKKYSDSFFKNFSTTALKSIQTIQEIPDIEIAKVYLNNCEDYAIKTTKFPGYAQKDIKHNIKIIDYSVEKKYLPVYILDFNYKNKKHIYCCDAITAAYFTGARPRANYFDEILMGIVGTIFLGMYLLRNILPIDNWAYDLSFQSSTLEILFLIFGIVGLCYVVISFVLEASKASLRRDEINYNGDKL